MKEGRENKYIYFSIVLFYFLFSKVLKKTN